MAAQAGGIKRKAWTNEDKEAVKRELELALAAKHPVDLETIAGLVGRSKDALRAAIGRDLELKELYQQCSK